MLDKLEKLASREKLMLVVGAVCLFSLLVERTVVNAIRKELLRLDEGISHEEEQLRLHRWYVASGKDIEPEYEKAEQALQKARDANEEMEAFNGQIDAFAVRSKVRCSDVDNRKPAADGTFETYVLSIGKFESEREGFFSFLHRLQEAPGLVRVREINMTPSKDDKSLQGEMTITKAMLTPLKGAGVREESS